MKMGKFIFELFLSYIHLVIVCSFFKIDLFFKKCRIITFCFDRMITTSKNRELSSRESSPVSALSMRGKIDVEVLSDFENDSEDIGMITDNEEKYGSLGDLNERVYESQTLKKNEKSEILDSFIVSRFNPSSSNVVCYEEKDDNFDLCLVAMKRGEVK
jgi:hypothetical protein